MNSDARAGEDPCFRTASVDTQKARRVVHGKARTKILCSALRIPRPADNPRKGVGFIGAPRGLALSPMRGLALVLKVAQGRPLRAQCAPAIVAALFGRFSTNTSSRLSATVSATQRNPFSKLSTSA